MPRQKTSPEPGSVGRLLNPVTLLLAALLILVGCLPFAAAVTLYTLYSRAVMSEAELNANKMAALLLRSFEQTIEPIDALLLNFADAYEPQWTPWQTYEALKGFALPHSIVQMAVIDKAGRMIASNLAPPGGEPMDLSDREHIRVHMQRHTAKGELFISKPVLGRVSKTWTIQLTRPLDDGYGNFGGVVVASYAISDFINFYKALRVEDDMAIALVGVDGIVRARAARAVSFGDDVSASAAFKRALSQKVTAYNDRSPIDAVERVGSVIHSDRYPMMVQVAYSLAFVRDHTSGFRAAIVGTGVGLGVALLILVILAGRYMAMQKNLDARELETFARQREADMLGAISRVPGVSVLHVNEDGAQAIGDTTPGPMARVMRKFASSGRFRSLTAALKAPLVRNEHLSDDGTELEVEMVVAPLRAMETDRAQGRRELVVFAVDQTSRRIEENKLYQMSKLASLGEVATGLAHEINQPLGVIRLAAGNALTGMKRGLPPEHLAGKLTRIVQQTERMSRIIDHMRIFGRKSDDLLQPCRPADAVEGALQVVGAHFHLDQIEVTTDLGPHLPLVLCRQDQLEQVLINLLQNARDALLERRRVLGADLPGRIRINVDAEPAAGGAQLVRIEVADNAGGIPEAIIGRIFQPFFTTKPPGKGTGLGLSVSFGIVRDHGGSFAARNGREGAIFTLRLPAKPAKAPAEALPAEGVVPG